MTTAHTLPRPEWETPEFRASMERIATMSKADLVRKFCPECRGDEPTPDEWECALRCAAFAAEGRGNSYFHLSREHAAVHSGELNDLAVKDEHSATARTDLAGASADAKASEFHLMCARDHAKRAASLRRSLANIEAQSSGQYRLVAVEEEAEQLKKTVREIAALRGELEWMRPIVEAFERAWEEYGGPFEYHHMDKAVAALRIYRGMFPLASSDSVTPDTPQEKRKEDRIELLRLAEHLEGGGTAEYAAKKIRQWLASNRAPV